MDLLNQISERLRHGDDDKVGELTRLAIDEGIPAKSILDDGLIAGMNDVGEKFRTHEILKMIWIISKSIRLRFSRLFPPCITP